MAKAKRRKSVTVADYVMDWMANSCPSWSIDLLLTHPDLARQMAIWVCGKMGWKKDRFAIHRVCAQALAARKRGELKRDRV